MPMTISYCQFKTTRGWVALVFCATKRFLKISHPVLFSLGFMTLSWRYALTRLLSLLSAYYSHFMTLIACPLKFLETRHLHDEFFASIPRIDDWSKNFNLTGRVLPAGSRCVSLQVVAQRMKSVGNIQKITAAMKMVAASRLKGAQMKMEKSRGLVQPLTRLLGDVPGEVEIVPIFHGSLSP